jgi:hypothetical protein
MASVTEHCSFSLKQLQAKNQPSKWVACHHQPKLPPARCPNHASASLQRRKPRRDNAKHPRTISQQKNLHGAPRDFPVSFLVDRILSLTFAHLISAVRLVSAINVSRF